MILMINDVEKLQSNEKKNIKLFLTIFDYLVLNNKCIRFSILYETLTQEEETLHVNLSCICRRELVSRKTRQ